MCGYKGSEGYWTITLSKPNVDGSGDFTSYSGVGVDVAKNQAFTLPECNVNVNGDESDGGELLVREVRLNLDCGEVAEIQSVSGKRNWRMVRPLRTQA